MKKAFKYIVYTVILALVLFYMLGFVLLRTPAVQAYVADTIESTLESKIGSDVEIGMVDLRLFNRVIIDDVLIYDQEKQQLLKAGRISVAIELLPLLDGKISISSAQLFGTRVHLYQKDAASPLNCQFLIDSLSSESSEKTPLDLHIASLIIRNGALKYDRLDIPKVKGRLSQHHIDLSKISSHIIINHITDDEVNASIKKLSLTEASGLRLNNLTTDLQYSANGNNHTLEIKDFALVMPETNVEIDKLAASFCTIGGDIDKKSLKANGKIHASSISAKDFAPLLGQKLVKVLPTMMLDADAGLSEENLYADINLKDKNAASISLDASVKTTQLFSNHCSDIKVRRLFVSEGIFAAMSTEASLPEQILHLGDVGVKGDAYVCKEGIYKVNADMETSKAGAARINAAYEQSNSRLAEIKADINTDGLNLARILNDNTLGMLRCDLSISGSLLDGRQIAAMNAKGHIKEVTYDSQKYTNIDIDGTYANNEFKGNIGVNDPNISFTADLDATTRTRTVDDIEGTVEIKDLYLAKQNARLNNVTLTVDGAQNERRMVSLHTDFADVNMEGDIQLTTLPQSITNLVITHLPSVPGLPPFRKTHNNYSINATVSDLRFIRQLTGVDMEMPKPLTIRGVVNDNEQFANIKLDLPSININGTQLNDTQFSLWTPANSLNGSLTTNLQEINGATKLNLECQASENHLLSTLTWNNMRQSKFCGTLNTHTHFHHTPTGNAFEVSIPHSSFEVGDTVFNITSKSIAYTDKVLTIDNLNIGNASQHVYVNGTISKSEQDSIVADLKNINVSYILGLVNFTSVEFDGKASGRAVAHGLLGDMNARAHLDVSDFLFQNGRMGTLYADAVYSNDSQQIDIDAVAEDTDINGRTIIDGFISPQRNSIGLNIKARNTRLEFMQDFCKSFLKDVDLYGDGDVTLSGDLSELELLGEIVAHGQLTVTSTNCKYVLPSDTVRLIPGDIVFNDAPIRDIYGNEAFVSGGIHHKHLGKMSYDILARTDRLLAYDVPTFDGNSFCGRAVIKGNVGIHGKGNDLNINARATTLDGSYIMYNTTSPDAIISQDFITWGSANEKADSVLLVDTGQAMDESKNSVTEQSTNIRMNFIVTATPEARLHLFMDALTGDYIDLFGSGDLRISYYNKGTFDIYGNYNIDNGLYRMTIQNIMRRDFQFQKGSLIAFGGDPFEASLRMKALYQLNSVSLSDLNIGSSFKANNVPVNCIMNITGTAGRPVVDFNLDLPSLGSDMRQMVYSVINSDESMNQQVLYLLAIGRFYPNDSRLNETEEHVGQTSLAMQSFLSGTFSQQLNQVINNLIRNNNWSFGTNIATGTDGLSNAEYEGTLSGRMLNNRLVFNGQFGYRNNVMTQNDNFIGDFDIQYLLTPNGNVSLKMYNQANDRYFTKNSLNTQGLGIILKKEFTLRPWFRRRYGPLKD